MLHLHVLVSLQYLVCGGCASVCLLFSCVYFLNNETQVSKCRTLVGLALIGTVTFLNSHTFRKVYIIHSQTCCV